MTFFSLLPIYLLGNFHCMGMCGPLVMFIKNHRLFYFYGRTLSFGLAGLLASSFGFLLNIQRFHISSVFSLFFGGIILCVGTCMVLGKSYPGHRFLAKMSAKLSQRLALLISESSPFPIFLLGFFTLLLPCGQTLVVFSALALCHNPLEGLLNGFLFAIFTSPALFISMQFGKAIKKFRTYYPKLIGIATLMIGFQACLKGFADWGVIPHAVLNSRFHIAFF